MTPYIIVLSVFVFLLCCLAGVNIKERREKKKCSHWFGDAWKKYD